MESLPVELQEVIFSFCSLQDLFFFRCVSRWYYFSKLVDSSINKKISTTSFASVNVFRSQVLSFPPSYVRKYSSFFQEFALSHWSTTINLRLPIFVKSEASLSQVWTLASFCCPELLPLCARIQVPKAYQKVWQNLLRSRKKVFPSPIRKPAQQSYPYSQLRRMLSDSSLEEVVNLLQTQNILWHDIFSIHFRPRQDFSQTVKYLPKFLEYADLNQEEFSSLLPFLILYFC